MANVNQPIGLVPRKHAFGALVRANSYQIASALASNLYRGSACKPVNTNHRIDVAAAGNRLQGVFHGVSYIDSSLSAPQYRPVWVSGTSLATGTVAEATVYDDPDILFGIQVSTATGMVATDIGNLADLVIGTGSVVTGNSGDMLDQTTLTGTDGTGGQLKIEDIDPIQGNDFGQYCKALVTINEHFRRGSATAGSASSAI